MGDEKFQLLKPFLVLRTFLGFCGCAVSKFHGLRPFNFVEGFAVQCLTSFLGFSVSMASPFLATLFLVSGFCGFAVSKFHGLTPV